MKRLSSLPKNFVADYVSRPRVGSKITRHLECLYSKAKRGWRKMLLERLIELHRDFDLRALSPEQICDLVRYTKCLVKNMNYKAYKEFCKDVAPVFRFASAVKWLRETGRIGKMYAGLRYCPYCNADTVFSLKISGRHLRSDLDHFFPQSKYPFLAISLYNWVPACTRCNRFLKNDTDPDKIAIPYRDDVHNGVHFDVIINNVEGFCGCKAAETYSVKALKRSQSVLSDRAAGFIDFFETEKLYAKMFGWEIADFMRILGIIASDYKSWVKALLNGADVNSLFWHDIPDEDDINQSRLSKLKIDMLRQFGVN